MKHLLRLALLLLTPLLFGQTLTLEYASGDVWAGDADGWTPLDDGAVLKPDQNVKLSPQSNAVVAADSVNLYLSNPGAEAKVFSLRKSLEAWKRAAPGQNLLASKLSKLVGKADGSAPTANMGVRAENMGQPGSEASMSDLLWDEAQRDLEAAENRKAVGVLTELLDYAEGERLVDTAVLLAQQYWLLRDWPALDAWASQALALPEFPTEQKQLVLYLQSLGAMAQDRDVQPFWDKIRSLDPQSELAQSLTPTAN
jgi:hypothetical protein